MSNAEEIRRIARDESARVHDVLDERFRAIEQRFEANAAALKHQATETERRLGILNGEHATLAQMKDTYVSREVYNKDQDTMRMDRALAIDRAQRIEDLAKDQAAQNRRTLLMALCGLATALVGWAITLAFHYVP